MSLGANVSVRQGIHRHDDAAARPILLTGCTGFVGRHLRPLLEAAFPERSLVLTTRKGGAAPPYRTVELSDHGEVDRLLREVRPGLVVHLAARASVGRAWREPSAVWRDNRTASVWLARAIARHTADATVFVTSTAEVYGRSFADGPADEGTPTRPVGPYGSSKLASEHAFRTLLPARTRLIVARPFNHTGPGQSETFVAPAFAAQLARIEAGLEPPQMFVGNLDAARDFLDVRDVVRAYVALMRAAETLPLRAVFNVARGKPVRIREVLEILLALVSKPVEVTIDRTRLRRNEIAVVTGRTDRLATVLDWPPERALEETLAAVFAEKRARLAASVG